MFWPPSRPGKEFQNITQTEKAENVTEKTVCELFEEDVKTFVPHYVKFLYNGGDACNVMMVIHNPTCKKIKYRKLCF